MHGVIAGYMPLDGSQALQTKACTAFRSSGTTFQLLDVAIRSCRAIARLETLLTEVVRHISQIWLPVVYNTHHHQQRAGSAAWAHLQVLNKHGYKVLRAQLAHSGEGHVALSWGAAGAVPGPAG